MMVVFKNRVLAVCVAGAIFLALLFAGYLILRGPDLSWPAVELGALVALLLVATAVGSFLNCRHHYRHALDVLCARLIALRANPSPHRIRFRPEQFPWIGELARLYQEFEALAGCYRQALADRVAQEEALESLRSVLGRVDDKGRSFTVIQRGSGSSRNMVARLAPNLHWITATPALQTFLGCAVADLNARPFLDFVHPDDVVDLSQAFREAVETGEAHNVTFRLLQCEPDNGQGRSGRAAESPPHSPRHVQMDVMTRYTDDGLVLHFRCHLLDVTDRVRAEQALRRRTEELSQTNERLRRINQDLARLKESYHDLYHQAPVIYFSLDARGNFVGCNDTLLKALGYQRDDLFGQPYTCLLTPEAQGRYLQNTDAYQQPGEVETQWVKDDGTVVDVWIRSTPVQDEQGRFVRSRSAAQDVTERNRLADELRRRGDELERANLLLRRINRELDDFTYVVSHDLKEPLRTLEAFSNFLAQDYGAQLGSEGTEYINHLVQASRRLGSLIDDLLALSRAGRITHPPLPFDLNAIVDTVCGDLAGLIQRKGARVRVEGDLPRVIGDPMRVAQLLGNLVGNGLKYNQDPLPEVVIGAVAEEDGVDGSDFATLYVRDNGIGIEPRFHEQIFGIFRRLHLQEEYEGTGAGLAISKKIIEGHGGRIWVESEPGHGSTFYFTLPRPVAPGVAAEPDAERAGFAEQEMMVRR